MLGHEKGWDNRTGSTNKVKYFQNVIKYETLMLSWCVLRTKNAPLLDPWFNLPSNRVETRACCLLLADLTPPFCLPLSTYTHKPTL